MTDVKQLPENLEQLEQLTEFKRVYKKHTVDQLENLLIEAEVEYLSADNKSELTWRLLDHRGFDFEAALAEENSDQSAPQDEPVSGGDEPVEPAPQDEPVPADDKNDANEDVQTVQDDADSDQIDSEASTDLGSGGENTDDSEKSSPADSATNDDAPTTQTLEQDKPADEQADNQSAQRHPFFNRRNQLKNTNPTDTDDAAEADHVAVLNTGAFPFFETATSTLVPAKKTTKIYPTASVDKEQILRNVKQYNHTRGNKLRVIN
ncbi:hypothetical protein ACTXJO_04615 [Psychrobacter celer]|uniref:hypothetical protein n=1 Tax=Psychrobacter celer TaxID=306572 RepID=UPI003FD20DC9